MKNILLIFLCAITLSFSACSSDTYSEDIIYPDEVTDVRILIAGNRYINVDNPYYTGTPNRIVEFDSVFNEVKENNNLVELKLIDYKFIYTPEGNDWSYDKRFAVYNNKELGIGGSGGTWIIWTVINSDTIIGTDANQTGNWIGTNKDTWKLFYGTWVRIK